MSDSSNLVSLQVRVWVAEEDVDKYFAALGSVFYKIARESACTLFEVYQSQENQGEILIIKNWNASKEWVLNVAMKRPYLAEYHAITEPMFLKPKEVTIVDRKAGNFSVVKTNNGQIWPADGEE
ncbi:putative quinol monooxygenase [Aspergillus saccharolyticus JOP 1030-1]|uniref:ABM domain-containing protein n=1 Tax=Aspergillus saccharolyticus JOP 1030-1 TaxID=1450539 RepID=A0A318Z801_9EURO|nr:hypothetical protein BP01DRAFT_384537 [Aspergillus saccharolyticus JOP 1030-1]PYH43336.1 hypothetical protein BP01DRAFT_384537 [Aspergillus saccharolyticus JOP 1030-1]